MSKQYALQQVLFSVLADGVHELVFRKADDTHRMMYATRDPILVEVSERCEQAFTPVETESKEKKERAEPNVLNVIVYDIDAKGWRSFRIDRLVSINGTGIGTLAGLIGCKRSDLEMGATVERYVSATPRAVYANADMLDDCLIEELIENAKKVKLVYDKYGTKTWFVIEEPVEDF